jgi:hypothetical protein
MQKTHRGIQNKKLSRQTVVDPSNGSEKTSAEKDVEKWLAIRKKAGRQIDPKTAEVMYKYALTLDPYGVYPELPEEC